MIVIINPGQFYEDCFYHPCLCLSYDLSNDEIVGVSLIDGSFPRSCSIKGCGIKALTLEEAVHWKFFGPPGIDNKYIPWLGMFPSKEVEPYRIKEISGA